MSSSITAAAPPIQINSNTSSAYHEVTRRLSPKQITEIERRISAVSSKRMDSQIEWLVDDSQPDWKEIFGVDSFEQVPSVIMEALKRGKISQQRWGTSLYFYSAHRLLQNLWGTCSFDNTDKGFCTKLFTDDGKLYCVVSLHSAYGYTPLFNDEQMKKLRERVSRLPPSEQLIFAIKKPRDWGITIRYPIEQAGGFLYLTSFAYFIVPSIGIMQEIGNVYDESHPVQLNPVLGVSSLEDVEKNNLEDRSDFVVAHPCAPYPRTADGFLAKGLDYPFHEWYHFLLRVFAGKMQRQFSVACAKALNPLIETGVKVGKFRFYFLDLEMGHLRPHVERQVRAWCKSASIATIPSLSARSWLNISIHLAQSSFLQTASDTLVGAKRIYDFVKEEGHKYEMTTDGLWEIFSYKAIFARPCDSFERTGISLFVHALKLPEMRSVVPLSTHHLRMILDYDDEMRAPGDDDRITNHITVSTRHRLNRYFYNKKIMDLIAEYAAPIFSSDPDL